MDAETGQGTRGQSIQHGTWIPGRKESAHGRARTWGTALMPVFPFRLEGVWVVGCMEHWHNWQGPTEDFEGDENLYIATRGWLNHFSLLQKESH